MDEGRALELANGRAMDLHSRLYFDEVGGTHWARGRTYKASASKDGFTYIPFLGPKAPRNFPLEFRLESVQRAGTQFELLDEAQVRREGDRFVLDRGDVEVRYDLELEQVEQSFAFTAPAGTGDITLEISVSGELKGAMSDGALRFSGEHGGVTYSEAFVLDGAGRVAGVPARWTGASIELTVPAAFVDTAQGPIIVDPLLGTEVVDDFAAELTRPDLAYDAAGDLYLAVYEEAFSAGDADVFSIFVAPSPFATSDGEYIELGPESWTRPKVAQQRNTRRFLVVAEGTSAAVAGSTDIVGRFRLSDGVLEDAFLIKSASSIFDCVTPDIGSEAGDFIDANYCIVYNRDYGTDRDVHAILVDPAGALVDNEIGLATTISEDEGEPAVCKSISAAGVGSFVYNVAWPSDDLDSGEGRVEAAAIAFDGSDVTDVFDIAPDSSTTTYFDVEISNECERLHPVTERPYFLVTFDDRTSVVEDAFVALCSAEVVHSIEELQVIEHHPKGNNEDNVVIGTLNDSFMLAYRSDSEVFVTIAQPIVDRLGMTERRVGNGAVAERDMLAIATTISGGSDQFEDGIILWSEFDGTSTNINSAFVFPDGEVASGEQYCFGVPNSTGDHGHLIALGDRELLSTQQLVAGTLPLNAFGFFIASTSQGLTPGAGGSQGTLCLGGSIGRFGLFNSGLEGSGTIDLDPQSVAQPTGTVSAVSGESWNFQAWHRDAVSGMATSNFTNAVTITFL